MGRSKHAQPASHCQHPHRHQQGWFGQGGGQADAAGQHWDIKKTKDRDLWKGNLPPESPLRDLGPCPRRDAAVQPAPRHTDQRTPPWQLARVGSTVPQHAQSKTSSREVAPAPASFPLKPWPREADRGSSAGRQRRRQSSIASARQGAESCQLSALGREARERRQQAHLITALLLD